MFAVKQGPSCRRGLGLCILSPLPVNSLRGFILCQMEIIIVLVSKLERIIIFLICVKHFAPCLTNYQSSIYISYYFLLLLSLLLFHYEMCHHIRGFRQTLLLSLSNSSATKWLCGPDKGTLLFGPQLPILNEMKMAAPTSTHSLSRVSESVTLVPSQLKNPKSQC